MPYPQQAITNPPTLKLFPQIEIFFQTIFEINNVNILDLRYEELVAAHKVATMQVSNKLRQIKSKNWHNYLQSWLIIFCPITPRDIEWLSLETLRREHKKMLAYLQEGEGYGLYQQVRKRLVEILKLSHSNPLALILQICQYPISVLNAQETELFMYHSFYFLQENVHYTNKDSLFIRSKIYLWYSNLALAKMQSRDSDDLSWWLSDIAKAYLFIAYPISKSTYSIHQLSRINNLFCMILAPIHDRADSCLLLNQFFQKLCEMRKKSKHLWDEEVAPTHQPFFIAKKRSTLQIPPREEQNKYTGAINSTKSSDRAVNVKAPRPLFL